MRTMTSPAATPPQAATPHPDLAPARWRMLLLWAGVPLCLLGLAQYRSWEQWASGRFGELVLLALLVCALAWVPRRFLRWSWAGALAVAWSLLLVPFAGPLPVLATALFCTAAVALGGALAARQPVALQAACGLVLIGAVLGWLLPLPLHNRWTYLLLCGGLLAWRRRALASALSQARMGWREAIAESPRTAAFAVLALGLASTGCWLPTMQFDDLGYHLRLPWQLLLEGSYPLDPATHVWALAPWLADVQQAVPQLISGDEARGPLNAAWIAITACGVWQLARVLGGGARAGWLSVALYASLPLTAVLGASMQTETTTAALLAWLVVLIARTPSPQSPALFAGAILVGGLLGLKLGAAALALLLLPWALLRHWPLRDARRVLAAGLLALALGSSSYVYAGVVAGNPFLPMFNAWFRSPFMPPTDIGDLRWHQGFDADLLWELTFDTSQYLEAYPGAAGFILVALAGAWVLALGDRRNWAIALMATVLLAASLLPMQYLRYAFPSCVVLLPVLVLASLRNHPRGAALLLSGVCVLNFAFQANGHWMLRTGLLKQAVKSLGQDPPLYANYAPERLFLQRIRAQAGSRDVLGLDPGLPIAAEIGSRGRTVSHYDPALAEAARSADADPSGAAWAALFRRERIGEVLLRADTLSPAQRAGLEKAGARRQAVSGQAQWWSLPAQDARP
ncbi:MAG: hypothetical protein EOP91_11285 [Lysobacteraceae bacterium]|nr:MAG: hypothetical protein EOP91_11285 [Xanthomonadaceae bacterium]